MGSNDWCYLMKLSDKVEYKRLPMVPMLPSPMAEPLAASTKPSFEDHTPRSTASAVSLGETSGKALMARV